VLSRVYPDEFLTWNAQRAGEWQNPPKTTEPSTSARGVARTSPRRLGHPPGAFWLLGCSPRGLSLSDVWFCQIGHLRHLICNQTSEMVSDVQFPKKGVRKCDIRETQSGPVFWWKPRTSKHGHRCLWTTTHTHMTAARRVIATCVFLPLYSFKNIFYIMIRIG